MTTTSANPAEELFADALEIEPAQREAFLDAHCPVGTRLRDEVERLLAMHTRMGDYLERPAVPAERPVRPGPFEEGTRVGRYVVVRVLGEGGGGTVYEARQSNPRRSVALKVMRSRLASEEARRRFAAEAQILARLEHPDVAHVYEAGVHEIDGRELPYIALEYVADARPLTEYVEDERLGPAARIRLMARVCRAVHHGHQKGIVHRDVKPANVLVDRSGHPRLIDFGIAQVDDDSVAAGIAGTAEYMSPEQCGEDPGGVDVRSDVYSLGVVLHELLTGSRPHDVSGLPFAEAARKIRDEPIAFDRLPLSRDLRAILERALARRRRDRYASASALASDLDRHLAHEPVSAVPAGLLYTASKFARRHRVAVAALVCLVAVSVAAAVVGSWLAIAKERQRRTAEIQSYVANLSAASAALREADVAEARLRLEAAPEALRNWEWHHLGGRLDASESVLAWPGFRIRCGTISRDGRLIAAGAADTNRNRSAIRVWSAETHEELMTVETVQWPWAVAFSPDGRRLAAGYVKEAPQIFDVADGSVVTLMQERAENVNRIAFLDDGARVLTASSDAALRVWDAATGELLRRIVPHDDRVIALAVAPDESFLVTGSRKGEIAVFELPGLTARRRWIAHEKSVEGVALFPDGKRLASCSRDGTVRLWDLESDRPLATLHGHEANVRDVAVSADGAAVVSVSHDRTVRVWSVADRHETARLVGHADFVNAVRHLPGGDLFASFSYDGSVRIWRHGAEADVPTLRGHTHPVRALAFSPDGRLLATGDETGSSCVWDLETGAEAWPRVSSGRALESLAFGERGERLLRVGQGFDVRVMREDSVGSETRLKYSGRAHGTPLRDPGRGWRFVTSPDVGFVAVSTVSVGVEEVEELERWRAHEGIVSRAVQHPARAAQHPALHHLVATADRHGELRIWSHDRSRLRATHSLAPGGVQALAFAAESPLLAVGATGGDLRLLDAESGRQIADLRGHSAVVNALAFSPDGRRLASGSNDATIRIWDVEEHVQVLVLRGQGEPVYSLAWSPDGSTLASGSGSTECHVKLWTVPEGVR